MNRLLVILITLLLTSCAHGMATHDPFDQDRPPDFDADEYNEHYEKKRHERKKDDPLFEQFYQKEKNQPPAKTSPEATP